MSLRSRLRDFGRPPNGAGRARGPASGYNVSIPNKGSSLTDHPSSAAVSVQVFDEIQHLIDQEWIVSVARAATLVCDAGDQHVSIVIADDATVAELNADHRGLPETTDVLSFAYTHSGAYYGDTPKGDGDPLDTEFILPPSEQAGLGEVIISYPQAARQAEQAGHSVSQELAILLAHGIVHLLGYDHEEDEEAAEMQTLEAKIMGHVQALGLLNSTEDDRHAVDG